jgi:hypothetical protein
MSKDIRIVIAQNRWVLVGEYERDGLYIRVRNGAVVRRWGTAGKGIGHLASHGPTSDTVLDPEPPTEMHVLAEVRSILCNPEIWGPALEKLR